MIRSNCPISSALDHVGDRWSLLIIRDIALMGKKSYGELLASAEGIATNILSSRLNSLEASGVLVKEKDPTDGRRHIYKVTQAGKDLIPILVDMILWSAHHNPEGLDIPEELVKSAMSNRDGLIAQLQNSA